MEKSQDVQEFQEKKIRVALVHDFLLYRGGAERVLRALADMFPEAPIYTLLYDCDGMRGMFDDRDVRMSFLGSWPGWIRKRYRWLLPMYGSATEAIDFRDFDLVISSSGAWTKGIITRLRTKHMAYIHSPMRFVWDENERYLAESGGFHCFKRIFLSYLRLWDYEASTRPDILISNSLYTKSRVKKYYRRSTEVVYPPVQRYFGTEPPAVYLDNRPFLTVSRLSKYKRTEEIVRAFAQLELPLVVVGTGRELLRLEKIASPNVRFTGDISDEDIGNLYTKARAFVFASDEDFGLALAEAQSAGLPAIALFAGGAKEIIDESSGVFFTESTASHIVSAVSEYIKRESSFDRDRIRKNSERFSKEKFQENILKIAHQVLEKEK